MLVGLFFLFPIFWVLLMSFQTNEQILRIPPSLFFSPTLENYAALISGKLETYAGTLEIPFMRNLWNSVILSVGLGAAGTRARRAGGLRLRPLPLPARRGHRVHAALVPLRAAAARAPAARALFPGASGSNDTYIGLIWVYQLITLPLILWIVRGYFEDISPDIEHAYRVDGHSWLKTFMRIAIPLARPGIAAAALLAFIFAWNNFVFALILASADKQPVTVGALAFVTASGIQYGQIAAALVLSVIPTLLLALYAQRYLVEGLSLGAVKG